MQTIWLTCFEDFQTESIIGCCLANYCSRFLHPTLSRNFDTVTVFRIYSGRLTHQDFSTITQRNKEQKDSVPPSKCNVSEVHILFRMYSVSLVELVLETSCQNMKFSYYTREEHCRHGKMLSYDKGMLFTLRSFLLLNDNNSVPDLQYVQLCYTIHQLYVTLTEPQENQIQFIKGKICFRLDRSRFVSTKQTSLEITSEKAMWQNNNFEFIF